MKNQEVSMNNGTLPIHSKPGEGPANDLLPQLWHSSHHIPEGFYDIQSVVTNLRMTTKAKRLQIIGVTSAVPGEGTSTITASMSMLIAAHSNRRKPGTLLIDAQLRHPSLHKIFGLANDSGLFELLHNGVAAQAFFRKAVGSTRSRAGKLQNGVTAPAIFKNTSASTLKIITIGQGWQMPLAQIDPEKFRRFLTRAKSKFEFVLIDIPPILSHADGIVLSKLCDGVVLVVHASQTRREAVTEAKRLLQRAQVNIVGGILNRRQFFIPSWLYRTL